MTKIFKAAIAARMKDLQLEGLIEVVMATPNPEIAVEMLLGVWEAPEVNSLPCKDMLINKSNIHIKSIDFWNDRVNFTYNRKKNKYGIYPISLPENERYEYCIEGLNSREFKEKYNISDEEYNKNYTSSYCYSDELETRESSDYVSINAWNGNY